MDDPSQQAPIEDENLEDLSPEEETQQETQQDQHQDQQQDQHQEEQEEKVDEAEHNKPEMSKVVENLTVAALREVSQINIFLNSRQV